PGANTGSAAVAAPGVSISATQPGRGYSSISGTSASAALVAGEAALLVADGKSNTAAHDQVIGASDPMSGRSFGRIDVASALGARAPTLGNTETLLATPTPGATPVYEAAANNFSISSASVTEGNSGTTTADF